MELNVFLKKYAIAICICACLLSLVFIEVGHMYREQVQLVLKREFMRLPAVSVDYWSVSHFLLFAFMGFALPDYHLTFCTIGAAFEVVEDGLSSDATTQLADCVNDKSSLLCKTSINDNYWYAKWDDVFANLLGYTVGSACRTVFVGN